jgi:hypothetical protein
MGAPEVGDSPGTRRWWAVVNNSSEGLLVRAQPLGAAEQISRRMVDVQVVNGALLLDADPAWAGAINTVLIKKGVRVDELRPVSDIPLPNEENGTRRSARPSSGTPVVWMHRLPACAIIYLRRGEEL